MKYQTILIALLISVTAPAKEWPAGHPAIAKLDAQNFDPNGGMETVIKLQEITGTLAKDADAETITAVFYRFLGASTEDLPKWEMALSVVDGKLETKATEMLIQIARNKRRDVPKNPNDEKMVQMLGRRLADKSPATLAFLLSSPDERTLQNAAEAYIGYAQDPKFIPVIKACLNDKTSPIETKKTVIAMLGYIPSKEALKMIREYARIPDFKDAAQEAEKTLLANNPNLDKE